METKYFITMRSLTRDIELFYKFGGVWVADRQHASKVTEEMSLHWLNRAAETVKEGWELDMIPAQEPQEPREKGAILIDIYQPGKAPTMVTSDRIPHVGDTIANRRITQVKNNSKRLKNGKFCHLYQVDLA